MYFVIYLHQYIENYRYYNHQGWLSGRVTTDDNFTFYNKPILDENSPIVPEGDYVADFPEKIKRIIWNRNYNVRRRWNLKLVIFASGLCDEISLVIAATADGPEQTPTLFMTKEGITEDKPLAFALKSANVMEEDTLWLRYKVK